MPCAVHISPNNMTKADYEKVIGDLQKSGSADPDGRLYHAAYGEDNVRMFEIWDSPEDFEAHRDRMFAAMQGAGVDAGIGDVEIHPLHSEHPD